MKKEVILILMILLFATMTYAACDLTDTINEGTYKTYSVEGKDYNISFTSYINNSAKFKVNGVSTPNLDIGRKHFFDDLSDLTILSVTSPSGNNTAEICFNAGLSGKKGTCSSNKDCDNNNPCTIDECDGDPLRCHHKLILWCRDNDGCCPQSRCTPEKDNDCELIINTTTATETRCETDSDCDDNNPSTKGTCDNTSRRCFYTLITECLSGDSYCPEACTFASDTDCDECVTDLGCNDNNACTSDSCSSGSPKRCLHNISMGCNFNQTCIPTGTRIGDQFCHMSNTVENLRPKEDYCDNDFECLNNRCIENECKALPFFKAITNWFKGLFS